MDVHLGQEDLPLVAPVYLQPGKELPHHLGLLHLQHGKHVQIVQKYDKRGRPSAFCTF